MLQDISMHPLTGQHDASIRPPLRDLQGPSSQVTFAVRPVNPLILLPPQAHILLSHANNQISPLLCPLMSLHHPTVFTVQTI